MIQPLTYRGTYRVMLVLLALTMPAKADAMPRIMSLNLCADAYLMAFAEKSQVLALSPQARDAELSAFHKTAQEYPTSTGQIESILALKPDLIIVSSYSDPMRNALIKQLGFKLMVINAADSFAAARAEIMDIGAAIGRTQAARAYLKKLDAEMAALKPVNNAPTILPLQRRNLTVGDGHILNEIIALAGGVNVGRNITDNMMGRVTLEGAVAARADYILVNETSARPDSRGMEFLLHPALTRHYAPRQKLFIDNNLLVCAGATTPLALASLITQLREN